MSRRSVPREAPEMNQARSPVPGTANLRCCSETRCSARSMPAPLLLLAEALGHHSDRYSPARLIGRAFPCAADIVGRHHTGAPTMPRPAKQPHSNLSDQPFVTMGGGALPLPMPTQPATLTATRVATKAIRTTSSLEFPFLHATRCILRVSLHHWSSAALNGSPPP